MREREQSGGKYCRSVRGERIECVAGGVHNRYNYSFEAVKGFLKTFFVSSLRKKIVDKEALLGLFSNATAQSWKQSSALLLRSLVRTTFYLSGNINLQGVVSSDAKNCTQTIPRRPFRGKRGEGGINHMTTKTPLLVVSGRNAIKREVRRFTLFQPDAWQPH